MRSRPGWKENKQRVSCSEQAYQIGINLRDLPRRQFLLAGEVWQEYRMPLDRAAELTLAGDEAFAEMRAFYEEALRPRMPEALTDLRPRSMHEW